MATEQRHMRTRGTRGGGSGGPWLARVLRSPPLLLPIVLCAAFLAAGCAQSSSSQDLPEFPEYGPAEPFLEIQRRGRANLRPPPPKRPYFGPKNQEIYSDLEAQQRQSNGELMLRARQREEFERQSRGYNQREFEALGKRLARDQAADANREQERAGYERRFREQSDARYRGYQDRLEALARNQEAQAREKEKNVLLNQQRVDARLAELRARQTLGPTGPTGSTPP